MHSENIVATARLGRLSATNIIARREASIRRWRPSDEKARLWGCIFAQCADMHPCNTNKYCFGNLPPPCTASPAPQLRAHLRLLVVMIFAKGERNCTGRTVSEHLANRKAGKAHNKHAQMLTFSVARSPRRAIHRQVPTSQTSALRRQFEILRHPSNSRCMLAIVAAISKCHFR